MKIKEFLDSIETRPAEFILVISYIIIMVFCLSISAKIERSLSWNRGNEIMIESIQEYTSSYPNKIRKLEIYLNIVTMGDFDEHDLEELDIINKAMQKEIKPTLSE